MATENQDAVADDDVILPRREVVKMTGLDRGTLYEWTRLGIFPAQVQRTRTQKGWRKGDVLNFLRDAPRDNRPPGPLETTVRLVNIELSDGTVITVRINTRDVKWLSRPEMRDANGDVTGKFLIEGVK